MITYEKGASVLRMFEAALGPAATTDPTPRRWKVPVCVRYSTTGAARTCTTLDGETGDLPLDGPCPTWLLLNADATGYYRSVVDPALARALLTPTSPIARAARLTPGEEMMLVADLSAMLRRDELPLDKLLDLVPLVAADPDEKFALWAFTAASFPSDSIDDALHAKAKRAQVERLAAPLAAKYSGAQAAVTRGLEQSQQCIDNVARQLPALRRFLERY